MHNTFVQILSRTSFALRLLNHKVPVGTISPFNTKKHNMENITEPTSLNDDDDDNKTNLPNTTNPTPR